MFFSFYQLIFMRLIIIDLNFTNPEKNLYIESRLFKIKPQFHNSYVLRLWQNTSSVIMGKFQKKELEVNLSYTIKNNIPVLKRESGGGTVYHDEGVLNISFGKLLNYNLNSYIILKESRFITSMIADTIFRNFSRFDYLIDERNGIFVKNKKVAGSAVAIKNRFMLYHISILINCNLNNLKNSIKWDTDYRNVRRTIQSKRNEVINLSFFGFISEVNELKNIIINKYKNSLEYKEEVHITSLDDFNIFFD